MDDLTLVGVHDDGEHVVLAGPGAQQYLLRVDEALRAAVRRDRARLGQLQIENDGRLRPRDVQARIRSGQSAEDVAAEAGVPVDYVRRYEGPVLAEREFVAQQAREVRTRHGAGPAPTLGQVVGDRLQLREAGDDVSWDAWRSDEGAWVVTVGFSAGGKSRQAQWAYDAQLRHIAPLDDEARWFTDIDPGPPGQPPARRLAPVPDGTPEQGQEPEPADAPPAAAERGPWAQAAGHGPDLLDTLRERRGRRTRPVPPEEEDGEGPDPVREAIDTLLSRSSPRDQAQQRFEDRSEPREHSRTERWSQARGDARPDPEHPGYGVLDPYFEPSPDQGHRSRGTAEDTGVLVLPDSDPLPPHIGNGGNGGPEPDQRTEPATVPAGGGRPGRKPRRASVPSWDDIVFGSRRD